MGHRGQAQRRQGTSPSKDRPAGPDVLAAASRAHWPARPRGRDGQWAAAAFLCPWKGSVPPCQARRSPPSALNNHEMVHPQESAIPSRCRSTSWVQLLATAAQASHNTLATEKGCARASRRGGVRGPPAMMATAAAAAAGLATVPFTERGAAGEGQSIGARASQCCVGVNSCCCIRCQISLFLPDIALLPRMFAMQVVSCFTAEPCSDQVAARGHRPRAGPGWGLSPRCACPSRCGGTSGGHGGPPVGGAG